MNFVDVTLEGSGADAKLTGANDLSLPLPPRLRDSVHALAGRKIIAGFRPEHLELNDAGPDVGEVPAVVRTSSSTSATRNSSTSPRPTRTSSRSSIRHIASSRATPHARPAAVEAPPVRRGVGRVARLPSSHRLPRPPDALSPRIDDRRHRARRRGPGGSRRPQRAGRRVDVDLRGALPDLPDRHRRTGRWLARSSARSSATREPWPSSRSTIGIACSWSASTGRRPVGSSSRCRRERSTSTRTPAPSRIRISPLRESSRRRPGTEPDRSAG